MQQIINAFLKFVLPKMFFLSFFKKIFQLSGIFQLKVSKKN